MTYIICSECGEGRYADNGEGLGECVECGHTVEPMQDVARYVDADEALVWTPSGHLAVMVA